MFTEIYTKKFTFMLPSLNTRKKNRTRYVIEYKNKYAKENFVFDRTYNLLKYNKT